MRIIVDADACPVKKVILKAAEEYNINVVFIHSICHNQNLKTGANITQIIVDNESQAADMAIINTVEKGDIVVTGDFGLASIVLMKGAYAISPNGLVYDSHNIDRLLFERHICQKARKSGEYIKGQSKRTNNDDKIFYSVLKSLIENKGEKNDVALRT